ncbi:MAG TPA: antibiotic biosynthesis monooxygenase [Drouetiella sp.]
MAKMAIVVEFETKPGAYNEFEKLIRTHAENCLKLEPGCLRFEVAVPLDENGKKLENKIVLNELYTDANAVEEHKATDRMKQLQVKFDELLLTRKLVLSELFD